MVRRKANNHGPVTRSVCRRDAGNRAARVQGSARPPPRRGGARAPAGRADAGFRRAAHSPGLRRQRGHVAIAGGRRARTGIPRRARHGQGRAGADRRIRSRDPVRGDACRRVERQRSVERRPARVHAPGGGEPRRLLPAGQRRRTADAAPRDLARRRPARPGRDAGRKRSPTTRGRSAGDLRDEPERQGRRGSHRSADRPCRGARAHRAGAVPAPQEQPAAGG